MAQEVKVMGAIYSDVPSVELPDSNGIPHQFTDVSDTTAEAEDVKAPAVLALVELFHPSMVKLEMWFLMQMMSVRCLIQLSSRQKHPI